MGDPVLHSTNCSTFFHASPLHHHTIPRAFLFSRGLLGFGLQGVRLFSCEQSFVSSPNYFVLPYSHCCRYFVSFSLSFFLSLSVSRAYQQLRSLLQPQRHAPGPPFPYLGTFALPTEASRQRRSSSVTITFYTNSMAIRNGSAMIDRSFV